MTSMVKQESPVSRLRTGVDIDIRDAGRNRGQGVFARRELQADELLARYTGRLWWPREWGAAFAAGLTSGDYVCDLLPLELAAPPTSTQQLGRGKG